MKKNTIWIDLENTPHVPFFLPIIRELERMGFPIVLTARDFAQTRELADAAGLHPTFIGREYGNATLPKVFGILLRAVRLAMYVRKHRPAVAIGHGSRGLVLAAKLLGIPSLTLYDYEGASVKLFNRLSSYVMTPEIIPFATLAALGLAAERHLTYPGLKEDVYVSDFQPIPKMERAGDDFVITVTMRPPSHSAHYRSEESFRLFDGIMQTLAQRVDIQVILLPRTHRQRRELIEQWSGTSNITIPAEAVAGLDLLSASDLVIGGGGTVNREAAALGVPVVTIFKGPMGAVDRGLIEEGRMVEISHASEIEPLLRKKNITLVTRSSDGAKQRIIQSIMSIVLTGSRSL